VRAPLLLVAAFVALAVARSAAAFDRLPLRMASHFDAAGRANGFMARDQFFVIYALASLGTLAVLLAIPLIGRAVPIGLLNIPHREYWLVPERIGLVHQKLAAFGAWFAVWLSALLYALLEGVLQANLEHHALDTRVLPVVLSSVAVLSVGSIVWLSRTFRVPNDD
jgi:uncharacterized membrane protein